MLKEGARKGFLKYRVLGSDFSFALGKPEIFLEVGGNRLTGEDVQERGRKIFRPYALIRYPDCEDRDRAGVAACRGDPAVALSCGPGWSLAVPEVRARRPGLNFVSNVY